ncbi:Ferrichrome outer membrane transporter/phage receptor [compost metagenome]
MSVYTPSYGHASDTLLGDHAFNHSDQQQYSLGYQFRHRFNEVAEFRQNLRYGQVDFILNNLQPQGTVTQLGLSGMLPPSMANYMVRQPKRFDEHFQAFTVDNQLQLDFATYGIGHTLLTGVDYSRSDADVKRTFIPLQPAYLGQLLPLLLNPVNPQYGIDVNRPTVRQVDYDQTIEQTGIYAQDQIKFDEHWLLTAGGRYDEVRVETDNYLVPSGSGTVKKHAFTGRAGLTYLTDFGLAPYVSYAESFTPNAGVVANNVTEIALEPSEAQQWEAGVKYQPNDRVLLTAAWFDITKNNVPSYRPVTFELTSEGEVRSKGLELEARLKLADAWDLLASYTYNDVEITKSANANTGNRPMQTPKNMASTWLNYSVLDGSLRGLSLGGGARYVGKTFGDDANNFAVDSYTLFDASVSYRLDAHITLSLNAQNLLDEEYVASCDSINSCYPGDSRTLLGSVKYDW